MDKILTAKEKWAYAHWCIFPGIFWAISPWSWVAFLLALFNGFTWFDVYADFVMPIVLHEGWYYRALTFFIVTAYVLVCGVFSYGLVYLCFRVYYFVFDKDEYSQGHFKRYHICKNYACIGCHDENCKVRAK